MVFRALLTLISVTLVLWGSAPLAQNEIDTLAIRKAIENEGDLSLDSIYPLANVPDEDVDSLLPVFVPFGEGEKLVYAVQYGIVNAGEATLEVRNISVVDSIPCYNIVSNARTNDVFSVFFKVRDRFVSLMDTTNLISVRYEKNLREGKFKRRESVRFDQINHKAIYKDKEVTIAPRTQDVLTSMYYVRTLPLKVGQAIALANHTDGKNYPLLVKVLRKERITVEAGTFDCLVVEPFLRGPAVFNQKGRLTVWVTDDRYKIPVLMKSKMIVGAVSAVLKDYRVAEKLQYDEQVQRRRSK
ncbi:MAG: DUF3108 domain-containing protein [Candidatus Krumholzibacteria bacterium]|nr:DUF3108 domain-containing protein [Candidatus Krumholzibacteria bacterium]